MSQGQKQKNFKIKDNNDAEWDAKKEVSFTSK